LGLKDRRHSVDRFDLHDHRFFHEEIQSQSGFNAKRIVDDWDRHLLLDSEGLLSQFVIEAGFIDAFEQSRANRRMNSNGAVATLVAMASISAGKVPWKFILRVFVPSWPL
jgi:hypothetical protein